MIKINLLGVAAPAPKAAAVRAPTNKVRQAGVFLCTLFVCFATVGLLDWIWNGQIAKLNVEIKKQRAEQTRLAAIKVENSKYEQERRVPSCVSIPFRRSSLAGWDRQSS